MKKILCITLSILLLFSLFSLSGCSLLADTRSPQVLKSYLSEDAPSQVQKTENFWAMLFSTYSDEHYSIRIGETPDSLREIYNVDDVNIWYFEADNNAVAWCEKSEDFCTYKVYALDSQKVETICRTDIAAGFQPTNVGIYDNAVYYCLIDYEKQEVSVLAYDIKSKATTTVEKVHFIEENQPYSINLQDEYLSFVCSDQIKVINLKNNEVAFEALLPDYVVYTYTASYDSKNDVCALYYADEDSEDIGIIKAGESEISSLFTFSENYYAFFEKIECHDGHIYWICQANVSGYIADHYTFVDYNYLNHKPTETKRTFAFLRYGNELYSLRYNRAEYTHVDLCQY